MAERHGEVKLPSGPPQCDMLGISGGAGKDESLSLPRGYPGVFGVYLGGRTSVLAWFCPCVLGLLWPSASPPAITLSMSRESMLDAEAHAELTLDLWDAASCSLTAPTEPVLLCCPPPDEPDEGRRSVAEEKEEEEEEEEEEVWRAASSMLREAFSSCEVMSSREMLAAAGRALRLPPRTVLAGEARVLLLALPRWSAVCKYKWWNGSTSAAPPSAGARVLGAGAAAPRASLLALVLAARRRVGFGDGVELLLDGAQVGHQGVQVHGVALVQRLCRERRRSEEREKGEEAGLHELVHQVFF
ncbi:hypothetical protein EYF80_038329 [Liparis tanakae]|uniref:Uncharacterized protein n=1 Tax=Liparis tanakae TaxID=230148 RepID=A0A4Z2GDQ6_9TELE|nr:hypothetical protein EYF80_038329 [Liparis tanakae]